MSVYMAIGIHNGNYIKFVEQFERDLFDDLAIYCFENEIEIYDINWIFAGKVMGIYKELMSWDVTSPSRIANIDTLEDILECLA